MGRGRVRYVLDDEDGGGNMLSTLGLGLLSWIVTYGMYLTLPLYVAMVAVGFVHKDDCPVNIRIPWYLMFGGVAGVIAVFLRMLLDVAWHCIKGENPNEKYDQQGSHPALSMVRAVMYLFRVFVVAWNITATFHIYNVVPDFLQPDSAQYCHKEVYMFAFVLVILFDVLAGIVIFIWLSAIIAGLKYPEMVSNLYEDDDVISQSSVPDLQFEGDPESMIEKQRQRRRRRKRKQLMRESSVYSLGEGGVSQADNVAKKKSDTSNGFGKTVSEFGGATTAAFSLPQFYDPRSKKDSDSDEISSNEDRNILSGVRFSHMVDSRRISKDYYSKLMMEEQAARGQNAARPGARRLKELFEKSPKANEMELSEKDEEEHHR